MSDTSKTAKIIKRWYHSPWHRLTVNVLLNNIYLSCTLTEILGPKDKGVTSLTFWGHVTSSVTWPLDSAHVVSYWWSFGTKRLSRTVTEILSPKDKGVTSLTFWGHVTSSVTWPSDSAWALSYWWSMMTMRLSCTDTKIRGFKDFGVTSLTFWGHVTSSEL